VAYSTSRFNSANASAGATRYANGCKVVDNQSNSILTLLIVAACLEKSIHPVWLALIVLDSSLSELHKCEVSQTHSDQLGNVFEALLQCPTLRIEARKIMRRYTLCVVVSSNSVSISTVRKQQADKSLVPAPCCIHKLRRVTNRINGMNENRSKCMIAESTRQHRLQLMIAYRSETPSIARLYISVLGLHKPTNYFVTLVNGCKV